MGGKGTGGTPQMAVSKGGSGGVGMEKLVPLGRGRATEHALAREGIDGRERVS